MILYRYLNAEYSLQLLQKKQWKVSRLLELNDPADCQPTLSGAPSQLSEEANEAFTKKYLATLHENIGIVSFSTRISDPVLWSHYADAHRGIAIGYDILLPHPQFQQVTYHDDRPKIDFNEAESLKSEGQPTGDFVMKIITNGFSQKAKTWEYEQEYRKFVYLNRCEMVGSNYFERSSFPSQVVLGIRCKVTESDVTRLCYRHGQRGAGIQVTRARFDNKKYTLNIPFPSQPQSASPASPTSYLVESGGVIPEPSRIPNALGSIKDQFPSERLSTLELLKVKPIENGLQ